MNYFIDCLTKKYACFSGRARRQEYWLFVLFNFIAAFVVGFIGGVLAGATGVEVRDGGARELLLEADCAAVASGTATLEAALARCPTVLVYRVGPFLAWFARRVIKEIRHVGLANVVWEKMRPDSTEFPMPELLQEDFTPEAVADQLSAWLADAGAREKAIAALDAAMDHLKSDGDAIGNAAREVLSCV